jgi:hypothetical protein
VKELGALTEENSALIPQKRFREIYDEATGPPFGFLFINSVAKSVDEMFWCNFDRPIPSAP